jgi:hypothetical protein
VAVTKFRTDTQVDGDQLLLGGSHAQWGSVGDGKVTLKDAAGLTKVVLDAAAATKLDVTGDVNITGNLNVGGTVTAVNKVEVTADSMGVDELQVNGDTLLGSDPATDTHVVNGILTINNTSVSPAVLKTSVEVNDGATAVFTIAKATGNTVISGTLTVNGHTELNSTLNVDGAVTMTSTLAVTGDVSTQGDFRSNGNLVLNDDAGDVTSSITMERTTGGNVVLSWDGTAFNVDRNTTVTGTLAVSGNISTQGDATLNSDAADVTATLTFARTTGGNATITWDGTNLAINKSVAVTGDLSVTGTITGGNVRLFRRQIAVFDPVDANEVGDWDSSTVLNLNKTGTDHNANNVGDGVQDTDLSVTPTITEIDQNLMVFKNGQMLRSDTLGGGTNDYAISLPGSNVIRLTFATAMSQGDQVHARFFKRT